MKSSHLAPQDLEEESDDYSGEGFQQIIAQDMSGQRLDHVLASLFSQTSRSQLQRWIADGYVLLNGQAAKPSQPVKAGQSLEVSPPRPEPVNDWQPQAMELSIVHEDDQVLVIHKPAGLVVHPAAGHASGTLVNGLLGHCGQLAVLPRCGIVHRLDRDTTGLMVVAKTGPAQLSLVAQLANRTVSRRYLALAWGKVGAQTVTTQIGRDPRDRQRMAVLPEPKGKPAITEIKPLAQGELFGKEVTLVRCTLQTGRTHQIRVHLEHLGCPIVGDRAYARKSPPPSKLGQGAKLIEGLLPGQALHAFSLKFEHPESGKVVAFVAPLPENLLEIFKLAEIKKVNLKTIA
jgi:23S rRNA pseudouridine1911/1915/1917 synthase